MSQLGKVWVFSKEVKGMVGAGQVPGNRFKNRNSPLKSKLKLSF